MPIHDFSELGYLNHLQFESTLLLVGSLTMIPARCSMLFLSWRISILLLVANFLLHLYCRDLRSEASTRSQSLSCRSAAKVGGD